MCITEQLKFRLSTHRRCFYYKNASAQSSPQHQCIIHATVFTYIPISRGLTSARSQRWIHRSAYSYTIHTDDSSSDKCWDRVTIRSFRFSKRPLLLSRWSIAPRPEWPTSKVPGLRVVGGTCAPPIAAVTTTTASPASTPLCRTEHPHRPHTRPITYVHRRCDTKPVTCGLHRELYPAFRKGLHILVDLIMFLRLITVDSITVCLHDFSATMTICR